MLRIYLDDRWIIYKNKLGQWVINIPKEDYERLSLSNYKNSISDYFSSCTFIKDSSYSPPKKAINDIDPLNLKILDKFSLKSRNSSSCPEILDEKVIYNVKTTHAETNFLDDFDFNTLFDITGYLINNINISHLFISLVGYFVFFDQNTIKKVFDFTYSKYQVLNNNIPQISKENRFFAKLTESIYRQAYSTNYIVYPLTLNSDFNFDYLRASIHNTGGTGPCFIIINNTPLFNINPETAALYTLRNSIISCLYGMQTNFHEAYTFTDSLIEQLGPNLVIGPDFSICQRGAEGDLSYYKPDPRFLEKIDHLVNMIKNHHFIYLQDITDTDSMSNQLHNLNHGPQITEPVANVQVNQAMNTLDNRWHIIKSKLLKRGLDITKQIGTIH